MVLSMVIYSHSVLARRDCRLNAGAHLMIVLEKRAVWCLAPQCLMTEEGVLFRLCISSNREVLATLYMHACIKII